MGIISGTIFGFSSLATGIDILKPPCWDMFKNSAGVLVLGSVGAFLSNKKTGASVFFCHQTRDCRLNAGGGLFLLFVVLVSFRGEPAVAKVFVIGGYFPILYYLVFRREIICFVTLCLGCHPRPEYI